MLCALCLMVSTPAWAQSVIPECLQQAVTSLDALGVHAIVVLESRSPGSTVDSATDVWRQERPDLLLWVGPDGAHILARWLSYGESRSLVRGTEAGEFCDWVTVMERAAALRWRTVKRLVAGLVVGLIGLALVWFRAPRRSQNSK